jgi:hypothetical protein
MPSPERATVATVAGRIVSQLSAAAREATIADVRIGLACANALGNRAGSGHRAGGHSGGAATCCGLTWEAA